MIPTNRVIPEIHSSMSLCQVGKIAELPLRAAALYFSHELDPNDALALRLAESVAVPEAGIWGANVQARLAEMAKRKKKRRRPTKSQTPPQFLPNIFLALLDLEGAQKSASEPSDEARADGS